MGLYNPKKKMPTSCYMCWDSLYCEYKIKNPVKMAQGRADDCPLIEIPDEIWEALKPKVDTMSMALKGWVEDVLKNKNGFGVDNLKGE